jgi:hypothetical protein
MSARRPLDPLPHEPLAPDEAAIARIHRALPAIEPSDALDARILAQARAASASPRRRPRPWFMGAGFGAAAAAVMAAGIAWQLGWIGTIPGSATHLPAPQVTAPADVGRGADADAERARRDENRVEIDYIREERAAEAMAPPPPAPPAQPAARRQKAAPPPPQTEAAPVADALPAPVPPPAPAAPPQPFPAESAASAAPLGALASGEADEAKREVDPQESEQLDTISVTGSRIAKARAALPPWTEDAQLDPEAWLERVRERVRNGDRQGAEHSLRRFVLTHPQRAVPTELQRLLVE